MTEAQRSYPFSVYQGDGATPEVFSRIPEVGDIKAPGSERPEIKVTTHDSPADEFLLGLRNHGECTFPVNFIPGNAAHQALWDASEGDVAVNFKITDDDVDPTMELAFAARVKPLTFSFPVDNAVKADVTLRVTGDMVLTVAGGA